MIAVRKFDRRSVIKSSLALGSFPMLSACSKGVSNPTGESALRPNFLFIPIDDLNDWIGVLGTNPNVMTPNIDALAGQGMLFENAHAQAPICGPSRASLMSG